MKWELDDNSRSGFHFLALGVLAIGIPSLLFWAFDAWHLRSTNSGALPLGVFHNGYILFDGNTMAVADTSRAERIGYACIIALAVAVIGVLVLLLFRSPKAWFVGRWLFAVCFCWCMVSALFLPRTVATIGFKRLEVHQRLTLVGDITIPFTTKVERIEWNDQDRFMGRSIPVKRISDMFRMAAYSICSGDTTCIGTTASDGDYFGGGATSTPADDALDHVFELLPTP